MRIRHTLRQSPTLAVLGGLSLLGTVTALVLLATGQTVAGIVMLLLLTQVLLLAVAYLVTVSYRRQEKRARTWGVRHSVGQQQLAQTLSAQRPLLLAAAEPAPADPQTAELHRDLRALLHAIEQQREESAAQQAARMAEQRRALFHEVFGDRR